MKFENKKRVPNSLLDLALSGQIDHSSEDAHANITTITVFTKSASIDIVYQTPVLNLVVPPMISIFEACCPS
ncbi:MAG: hypothetical protein A2908_00690 [Candidatus Staskawiczbacteria bacterium RIFCSPLOWO2_01_FULL_38_12b]|uniref:Uncharacterized protein n=1 Tax=Candidatus Staskawiczbacteria bacterium RIFCSPLOWO2_01_FULL_38_12b TaxID=1802214 RepID=A0A1G2IFQ3_9BACT|nr:MAG: hypothetical protein A2908_00690 [Candidatus Staskawiczbacteria bacterium RIFCSPLOWO2_01_FULL_38_12b]